MEHKYKVGDKVWKAEANDSFQQEVLVLMDIGGNPFYRITWGTNTIAIAEKLIFDTKEECEKHRLETFKSILDENGKLDEAKLAALRPPKEPIPDDGKVRVVYNGDWGGFGLSDEAIKWLKEHGLEFEDEDEIPRHNKLLVQCIHELGSKANDKYSDLRIWVLSGNRYYIEEYDGRETVHESDDEEWIEVKNDN